MRGRDFIRLHNILEADKEELNGASKQAAIAHFKRVADEYFEIDGELGLDMIRGKNGSEVTVKFRIHRVKNFTCLK